MSIRISHLTKIYGHQEAVKDISFSVKEGEIVGFLGPNGAGKSTTMKIATGYLPPSAGEVIVAGFDVTTYALEAKKNTGYLPEHNPLYLDMYVHEYLAFSGSIFGYTGSRLKHRINEMIDLCGLTGEQNKKIESLSKGYRQRVGLAQALIHDPKVLILDEPTSGLDPNQITEIRKLIKSISRNKTVIFSTHIMQEVQALCDRVIVINKGELVADDRLENILKRKSGIIVLVVEFEGGVTVQDLNAIPQVAEIEELSPSKFRVIGRPGVDLRPEILRFSAERKVSLLGFKQEESSLENIFKELTSVPGVEDQSTIAP
jgi:ABC-2 type transport system ATP-binding protein